LVSRGLAEGRIDLYLIGFSRGKTWGIHLAVLGSGAKRENLKMFIANRAVETVIGRTKVDAIIFWSLENIRYLCGFTGSDGALIVTGQERIFLSDSRYDEQMRVEVRDATCKGYKQKIEGVARLLKSLPVKRLGFESAAMPYESYQKLQEKLPRVSFIPLAEEIRGMRARKDPAELEKIHRAIQIATDSFADASSRWRPGIRERVAAEFLECRMRRRGGEKPAFDTIVASGSRAALPHGKATDRRMQRKETVVVDFGVCFQGYHSDETKTLILGKPDAEQRRVYTTVRRAQEKAMKAIRPGVSVRRIDEAAREVIARAGYGKFFGHGTGHGVGLAVHEEPSISPRGRGVVKEGMVFTVEPGIYIPGWGGVRLEDMVLVTARGYEVLTYLSKDLRENIYIR
jgi:Xaa-Pro aminopeptidase